MFGHLSNVHEEQQLLLDGEMCGSLRQEVFKITILTELEHEAQTVWVFRIHPICADYTRRPARSQHDSTIHYDCMHGTKARVFCLNSLHSLHNGHLKRKFLPRVLSLWIFHFREQDFLQYHMITLVSASHERCHESHVTR